MNTHVEMEMKGTPKKDNKDYVRNDEVTESTPAAQGDWSSAIQDLIGWTGTSCSWLGKSL